MKTSCAINFSKLGFMEKLTNPLLEWCGWEDFKRFPWSIIDHDHTLLSTHSGDCRQQSHCFQLLSRPGGMSGRRGRVSAWSSAGWGPHGQPEAGVLPTRLSGHVMSHVSPDGPAALSLVISSKVSLYHPPGEGGFFRRMRGRGKRKTHKFWASSSFPWN